jgi:hypothetical protein
VQHDGIGRHHYWNRLPEGSEVKHSAVQFLSDEEVIGAKMVARPPDAPSFCVRPPEPVTSAL